MIDLRLVPAAAAGWASSWTATGTALPDASKRRLLWAGIGLLVVVLVWWAVRHRRGGGRHALTPGGSIRLALVLTCAVAVCTGIAGAAALARHRDDSASRAVVLFPDAPVTLRIRLTEDPAPSRQRFARETSGAAARILSVTAVDGVRAPSTAMIWAQGQNWSGYSRGDELVIRGAIDTSFHANPPYVGSIRAKSSRLAERPGGWMTWVRDVRGSLVRACDGLSDQGRALVPGMAVGDDRAMTKDLEDAMRTTSLTHLVAVSGSHIAIIMAVLGHLLPGDRRVRVTATLAVLAGIVALVGPEPSVLRSVSVAAVGVTGMLVHRSGQGIAALAAVVIVFLLLDPWASRSYGFALSVVATVGVAGPAAAAVRWSEARLRGDTWVGRTCRRLVAVLAIPVSCQLLVLPILVMLDDEAPVWGVLANVLAGPAVAPATVLALTAALVAPSLPGPAQILAGWSSVFTGWVAGVAETIAAWPGAQAQVPGGTGGVIAGYGIAAACWWVLRRGHQMLSGGSGKRRRLPLRVRPPTIADSHMARMPQPGVLHGKMTGRRQQVESGSG